MRNRYKKIKDKIGKKERKEVKKIYRMSCEETSKIEGQGCRNSVFLMAVQGRHLWKGFTD